MKAVYGTVKGEVQGVGFRYFARRSADRLGIDGWVRNCDDGAVEFLAQAEEKPLSEFLNALRLGPAAGRVDALDVREAPADPAIRNFEIRE